MFKKTFSGELFSDVVGRIKSKISQECKCTIQYGVFCICGISVVFLQCTLGFFTDDPLKGI